MNDILANKLVAIAARCSIEKDRQTIVEATTALRASAPSVEQPTTAFTEAVEDLRHFSKHQLDRNPKMQTAIATVLAGPPSTAITDEPYTDEMIERALTAYEKVLLDLHANAYSAGEPVSVSEMRGAALRAALAAAFPNREFVISDPTPSDAMMASVSTPDWSKFNVSVDVSTGDDITSGDRIFGAVIDSQPEADGTTTLLCEYTSDNFVMRPAPAQSEGHLHLGDIVEMHPDAPYAAEWANTIMKVVSLRIEPDGRRWISVIEGNPRHRGNGFYDGETDCIEEDHLQRVAPSRKERGVEAS